MHLARKHARNPVLAEETFQFPGLFRLIRGSHLDNRTKMAEQEETRVLLMRRPKSIRTTESTRSAVLAATSSMAPNVV